MTPRGLVTAIGATALGLGVLVGAVTIPDVLAQEATTPVAVPAQSEQRADFAARRAAAYDGFVAALASELSVDETAVDTAIRGALKQQVAAWQAAGALDSEQATALQAEIDTDAAPLPLAFGHRGMHGHDRHDGFMGPGGHRGPKGGLDGIKAPGGSPSELPAAPPAELPGDQDTPLNATPSDAASA